MARVVAADPNAPQVKLQRKNFCRLLLNLIASGAHVVNYDETAVQNFCNADRFWSKKGKQKFRLVGKQVERLTIVTAISTSGTLFAKI